MLAIATTLFMRPGPSAHVRLCSLAAWCAGALQLARQPYMRAEVLVVSDARGEAFAREECGSPSGGVRFVRFGNRTLDAIGAYQAARLSSDGELAQAQGLARRKAFEKRVASAAGYMAKWDVVRLAQYEAVLFVDVDALLLLHALSGQKAAAAARHAWTVLYGAFMLDGAVQLLAEPSTHTMINTGLMLLKPSARVYEDGLAAMRGGFDDTDGFERAGPPLQAIPQDVWADVRSNYRHGSGAFPRGNRWIDVDNGDIDQGHFLHMYAVREKAFRVARYRAYSVLHFFGTTKPWISTRPKCAPLFELLGVLRRVGQPREGAPAACTLNAHGDLWPASCANSTYYELTKRPQGTRGGVAMSCRCEAIFRAQAELLLRNLDFAAGAGDHVLKSLTLGCSKALRQSVF